MDTIKDYSQDNIGTTSQSTESSQITANKENKFEKISLIVFLITVILSPLIFVSTDNFSLDVVKTITISTGFLISFILYAISLYSEKTLYIPKHPITIVGGLFVVSVLISTFLSTSISKSLFGQGFEIGTASFTLLMVLVSAFVMQMVYKNRFRMYYIYSALISSFAVLMVFHILRLFSTSIFSFGIFTSTTSTLLGKWYDLGIFSGLIFLLTFFTLNILNKKGITKVAMWVLLVISAFFLLIINSTMIWFAIAIVLLGYSFYFYSNKDGNGSGVGRFFSKISIATSILLIVSVVLAFQGKNIVTPLVKSLNLNKMEISLPWQLALDVSTDTVKVKPLFGAGPNRFTSEFLLNKPQMLNPSDFWNVEFSTGFGFIPSFIVTQGMVGIVLWILFLIFFVTLGVKTLKKSYELGKNYAAVSSFFISSFLWLVLIVYNPSHVMLFVTFIMTGVFVAIACSETVVPVKNYSKLMIIIASLAVIVSVIWAFVYVKKTVAFAYFQSGVSMLNTDQAKDVKKIENSFKSALSWDESDIYYQALSELTILKINDLAQKIQGKDEKSVDQEMIKQIGVYIEEAVAYTNKAIELDPTNYYNHTSLARISEIAFSLKVQNAYENTKTAYANALSLNPYNPALYLNLARLEVSKENLVDAQKYIGTALQLKQNYIEAIFLLSQIQVSQGQIKDAITSVQVATQINPNDPILFFQLGLLHYNDKNYQGAVDAFTKAVTLNDQYANAQYFLGLSYARLNKNLEAIDIFEKLSVANPDNEELTFILTNLKANKSPFADVKPPSDSKPETRKTLPVKEKTTESTKTKKAN